jgi:hypothetical protein
VTAVDDPDIWPTTAGTILPENWQKTWSAKPHQSSQPLRSANITVHTVICPRTVSKDPLAPTIPIVMPHRHDLSVICLAIAKSYAYSCAANAAIPVTVCLNAPPPQLHHV